VLLQSGTRSEHSPLAGRVHRYGNVDVYRIGMPMTLADEVAAKPTIVYRLYDAQGALLYVGMAIRVKERLQAHKRLEWWPQVARVEEETFPDRMQACRRERDLILDERPLHNKRPYDNWARSARKNAGKWRSRCFTVTGFKGGVGKTTVAVNVAGAFAVSGLNVLLIDADPQGAASASVGIRGVKPTLYEAMHAGAREAWKSIYLTNLGGLDVIPADVDLSALEIDFGRMRGWQDRLREIVVRESDDYDVIIIDSGPGLGRTQIAALRAAPDGALLVVQPGFLELRGLHLAFETIELAESTIAGIVPNAVDRRTLHEREALAEIERQAGARLLPSIPRRVALKDCGAAGEPIVAWYPKSDAAEAFRRLSEEVLTRAQAS